MSISGDVKDLELGKFRESQIFPNKPVVAVQVEGTTSLPTTNPLIQNVDAEVSNQVYELALPANCKGFWIQARFPTKWKFSYEPSFEKFITLGYGSIFKDSNFYAGQSIYFSSERANNIFELITYT